MRRSSLVALTVLLTAALAVPGLSQPAQPARPQQQTLEPQDVFTDVVEVRAVNIQVVVTDRSGRRVPGLTAKDFRILLDGQEVPLDYFAEVRDSRISAPEGAETATETGAAPAEPDLPPGLRDLNSEVVGTNYLIFIDELFSPIRLRCEALKVMAGGLDRLKEQDRMAVVAFNGRDLRVLSDWTSPSALKPLFQKAAKETKSLTGINPGTNPIRGEGREPWLKPLTTPLDEVAENSTQEREADNIARNYTDNTSLVSPDLDVMESSLELEMIKHVVAAASATLRSFSPRTPPGRKVMILVSGGWNFDVVGYTQNVDVDLAKRMLAISGDSGYRLLRPLIDSSNLLGYTIYPVHLAEHTDVLPGADISDGSAFVGLHTMDKQLQTQFSLASVAKETGGSLLVTGARHLQRISEDTSSYYWLGFSQSGGDDKRRDLKVEVLRKGLDARARSSYLPLSRPARAAMDVETALVAGGVDNAGPLAVEVGKLRRAGLASMEIPVTIRIPLTDIALVEEGRRRVARLELRVAALDRNGRRSEVPVLPIVITKDQPPAPGMHVVYETRLKLRRDAQDVQLILHDLFGGKDYAARVHVEP